MKNIKKSLLLLLSLIIVSSIFGINQNLKAAENNNEQEVNEKDLTEAFEVTFDKSEVVGDDGIVGYNEDIIKKELANNQYKEDVLTQLDKEGLLLTEQEAQETYNLFEGRNTTRSNADPALNPKWEKARASCVKKKLAGNLPTSIISSVASAIGSKQYAKAAGIVAKKAPGIAGGVFGAAATYATYNIQCNKVASNKYPMYKS